MLTSYFARLRQLRADPSLVPISIARFTPDWADIAVLRGLMPRPDMLKMDYSTYKFHFDRILASRDPQAVWDNLHIFGGEPVLLCFEAPPFTETNFCHRRMVADWFEETLGQQVDEWQPPGLAKERRAEQMELFG